MRDYSIIKTDSKNSDFIELVKLLDIDLEERYGELQKNYVEHNRVDILKDVVVLYFRGSPAACGALKEFDEDTVELKRMFVRVDYRRLGLAKILLKTLEELAINRRYKYMILETGKKQFEAVNLYKSFGFGIIENYGQYVGNTNSICMKKCIIEN